LPANLGAEKALTGLKKAKKLEKPSKIDKRKKCAYKK
jgi:hypothetical protein